MTAEIRILLAYTNGMLLDSSGGKLRITKLRRNQRFPKKLPVRRASLRHRVFFRVAPI